MTELDKDQIERTKILLEKAKLKAKNESDKYTDDAIVDLHLKSASQKPKEYFVREPDISDTQLHACRVVCDPKYVHVEDYNKNILDDQKKFVRLFWGAIGSIIVIGAFFITYAFNSSKILSNHDFRLTEDEKKIETISNNYNDLLNATQDLTKTLKEANIRLKNNPSSIYRFNP
jgi:hypothetical protein